jgi:hypothetical protein
MEKSEAMDQLSQKFKGQDWFYDVGLDQYGRIVVYAHWINSEVYKLVPDNVEKFQVLIHFAGSKTATREQFVTSPTAPGSTLTAFKTEEVSEDQVDVVTEVAGPEDEEKSLPHLQKELDRLERVCGSYTLQDIFYEIQDGKNAVTNLSARYPEVHDAMKKLYDQYGFDVIYEELDG